MAMTFTVTIPDEIARQFQGQDLQRQALEGMMVQLYRSEKVNAQQLRTALGMESRSESDAFLHRHGLNDLTIEEIESDLRNLEHARVERPDAA